VPGFIAGMVVRATKILKITESLIHKKSLIYLFHHARGFLVYLSEG
jgi:hypothetical protein